MKVLKSFIYGTIVGTKGTNITVEDQDVKELLVKKGILAEEPNTKGDAYGQKSAGR